MKKTNNMADTAYIALMQRTALQKTRWEIAAKTTTGSGKKAECE
jgi:hypothetical protein